MKKIILILCLSIPLMTFAQDTHQGEVFMIVEDMPEFPGGTDSLYKFISSNITYPADALRDSIQGTVYLRFIIDSTGAVTEPKVLRGVSESLDNEALRVVKLMPNWRPGRQRGKNVHVIYNLPIKYKLN